MIAMGVANVVSSFFSSIPVTGSFSRTAVNYQTGVRTPLGGVFTGGVVLLALGFLAPLFKYIPKAALAAVIISRYVVWGSLVFKIFFFFSPVVVSLFLFSLFSSSSGFCFLLQVSRFNDSTRV